MFRYITSGVVCLTAAGISLAQQPQAAAPAPAAALAPPAAMHLAPAYDAPAYPAAPAPGCQPCEPVYADCLTAPAPGPRFWASAELLVWWVEGQRLPPLLTTSPAGTPVGQAGVLGRPGTRTLFGGSEVNDDARLGGRLTAGMWLDDCRRWGVGGEFFYLEDSTDTYVAGSPGSPILARPFFNTATGAQDAEIVAYPGVASGRFAVSSGNELLGASAYLTRTLCCSCCSRWGLLLGYRYLRLEDEVTLAERVTAGDTGTVFTLTERYRTVNEFHGGDVGLTGRVNRGRVYLDGMARLGIGATRREVSVAGTTQIQPPGQPGTTFPGALYAQGVPVTVSDTVFSLAPEFRLNLGYRVTDALSVFAGYNLLWWTNVARAGDQINARVNPALLPPATAPLAPAAIPIRDTTVWVQGVSFGVALNY